ncbi:hypothetical protein RE9425_29670 [Prescottella equi]|nr:hypothetical protein RE9425_29670 [Prescottella equi]
MRRPVREQQRGRPVRQPEPEQQRREPGLGCGSRSGRGSGRRSSGADNGELAAHVDDVVLLRADLEQHTGDGRRDLGVDLVRRDLEEGLVDGNLVTDGLEPAGDGALGDRLAQLRHRDRGAGRGTVGRSSGGRGGRSRCRLGGGSRSLLGGGRSLLGGGSGSGLGGRRLAGLTDHGQLATDVDDVVLLRDDLRQDAGSGRRDLGVDLVGGDFEQRLVYFDRVPFLLEPPRDSSLGDGFTQGWHLDGEGHFF